MIEVSNTTELIELIRKNRIIIYGAGFVGNLFYDYLKMHQLHNNVRCFVTSSKENTTIDEKEIICIDELKKHDDEIICIAVHGAVLPEIESKLKEKNIVDSVWIHPFLYELKTGAPIKEAVLVPLKRLVRENEKYYELAVRYAVIENYYGKIENGYEIYTKAMMIRCDKNTAEKRLRQFIDLIKCWDDNMYDETQPIAILENGYMVDGSHRIALLSYFMQETIICDIYSLQDGENAILGEEHRLSKQSLIQAGIAEEEIEMLDVIKQRIGQYYL